jgi:hypothetical protein
MSHCSKCSPIHALSNGSVAAKKFFFGKRVFRSPNISYETFRRTNFSTNISWAKFNVQSTNFVNIVVLSHSLSHSIKHEWVNMLNSGTCIGENKLDEKKKTKNPKKLKQNSQQKSSTKKKKFFPKR